MYSVNHVKFHTTQCLARGFTLLELMISLAIISLIMTLGVPTLMETLVSNRVNGAIYSLNKDIISARNFAINYENNITMCHLSSSNQCDGNWCSGYTVFIDANGDQQFDAVDDEKLIVKNKIPSGDTLVFTDGNSLQFAFDGRALTTFSNEDLAAFKYCPGVSDAENYSRAILLNLSGRPRTSEDIDNDGKDEISGDSYHISCS